MMGMVFVVAGCQYNEYYYDENSVNVEDSVTTSTDEEKVTASAVSASTETKTQSTENKTEESKKEEQIQKNEANVNPDEPMEKLVYDSAYDRFLDNVVIKARSENYVMYEYKDVRVDELAPLASRYCKEHGNRTAVLRNVILYKNYARRATFDCLNLQ